MNIISFGEGACEKIRRYLDSYVSNELLVETNHEVLRHLEGCPSCSAEMEARSRLRNRLKSAVQRQDVPPDLEARIRERIRSRGSQPRWASDWTRWAIAAAAVLVVAIGTLSIRTPQEKLPPLEDRPAQDAYIQRISNTISAVLSVGLKDHVHCSVFRKYPANPPTLEQMTTTMGPAYSGLLQLVKTNIPEHYRIVMAHQCGYKGRRFVHLTMRDGDHLVSLVIAKKQDGETLAKLSPALRQSGIPVYQALAHRYEVAGFETDEYMAFVVSDLSGGKNLQIAQTLAPAVHGFLAGMQG